MLDRLYWSSLGGAQVKHNVNMTFLSILNVYFTIKYRTDADYKFNQRLKRLKVENGITYLITK